MQGLTEAIGLVLAPDGAFEPHPVSLRILAIGTNGGAATPQAQTDAPSLAHSRARSRDPHPDRPASRSSPSDP